MSDTVIGCIAAIVVALIIGITVVAATGAKNGIKAEVKKAEIEANTKHADATAALASHLESIEKRLATIEKTLTDIP